MKKSFRETIRQQLLADRQQLLATEDEYAEAASTVELDQTRVGRVSRMDAMQSQQMALEQHRRRQLQLQKIEGALLRLDNDEYGECFICGDVISDQRLMADPTATRCISCVEA